MGGKSSSRRRSVSTGSSSSQIHGRYSQPYAGDQQYPPNPQSYPHYSPYPGLSDHPSQSYQLYPQSYGHRSATGGANKRSKSIYSRIADNYKTLDEVTSALAKAGLESSNLIVGIDFTKSNEWTGRNSFNRQSLHHIGNVQNPYEQAISIIGRTLSSFDDDNLIPCFGFGDASTHDENVFSFYPDERPCKGFEEVLSRYKEIIPHLRLSGPTSFAPIIEMAMTIVEHSGGQYHVLLVIADGQVTRSVDTESGRLSTQEQRTVNAIVQASEYPLSIVLVGVGDGPWDMMMEFDDNIPDRAFDNFQFVNFTEIMSKSGQTSTKETEFALAALMEIPSQYVATLELGFLGLVVPQNFIACPYYMGGKSSSRRRSVSTGSSSSQIHGRYSQPYAGDQQYPPNPQSYPHYSPYPGLSDHPSQSYQLYPQSYGHRSATGGANKRSKSIYSRIADNYKTLDEVTSALAKAGLESSNLIVGIDFTKSNEWTGRNSFNRQSLHHIGNVQNPYEQAISIIGRTLSSFDDDNLIPCFGFGDASTHDENVFSFYPDERPCKGFEEVLSRYKEIIPHLRLSGPTSFAPIIEMAMTIVEHSGGQYHVLLVIADGQVTRSVDTESGRLSTQEQRTVNAIVQASEYPLSIVLVGVGDGPWDMMMEFDDNIPDRAFDNFQFVNFTEIMSKSGQTSTKETEFALAALMEIPSQYVATLELGFLGRRTGRCPERVPLPTPARNYGFHPVKISEPTSSEKSLPFYTGYASAASSDPVTSSTSSDIQNCPVCFAQPKNMAFTCGHQTCYECGSAIDNCPICRAPITTRIRLY